jgi:mono/diheme cytochrome c family protein
MTKTTCLAAIGVLTLWRFAAESRADVPGFEGRFIEVFHSSTPGNRTRIARIDLDGLRQQTLVRRDPQYNAEIHMRGAWLSDVLASVAIPPTANQALLRFDNGMLVPVSFRDPNEMLKLAAFVARATARDRWTPLVAGQVEDSKQPPTEDDLRAVSFHGNKLVVNDNAPAGVLPSTSHDLKPWLHVDTLSAIELVDRVAWEQHFNAGPATAAGQVVYLGTCRYCHAVRGVGGAMGWDFVEPYPLLSERWAKSFMRDAYERRAMPARTVLSLHVRFRAGVDGNRTMPALRGMRDEEVRDLWSWVQAIAAPKAH